MIRESSLMAPYIKHPTTTRGIMLDVMLCMAALYLIAAFYYGWRAVMLGVVSMAVCMLCEWLAAFCGWSATTPMIFRHWSPA